MFKKIMQNKALFVSFLTFFFSLFCFVTIGYAWIAISNKANVEDFVAIVADNTLNYQFSQVIDNGIVHSNEIKSENVMPGESNTFILTIANRGNMDSLIDVNFLNVFSEIDLGSGFTKEYLNHYQKLQYAYSYCVDLITYVPDDVNLEGYSNEAVKIPSDEELIQRGWEKVIRNNEFNYFNKVDENLNDEENYPLISNLVLNHKVNDDNSVKNKATVLLYFTVKFNNKPIIPTNISVPSDIDFNGEYYANQRFVVSNILIKGLD